MIQWHYPRYIVDFFSPRASVHSHLEDLVWSCEPLIEMLYSYKTGPKKLRLLRWLWFNLSVCVIEIKVPWVWRKQFQCSMWELGMCLTPKEAPSPAQCDGLRDRDWDRPPLSASVKVHTSPPCGKNPVSPWRENFQLQQVKERRETTPEMKQGAAGYWPGC